jgi:hypothetical protein
MKRMKRMISQHTYETQEKALLAALRRMFSYKNKYQLSSEFVELQYRPSLKKEGDAWGYVLNIPENPKLEENPTMSFIDIHGKMEF